MVGGASADTVAPALRRAVTRSRCSPPPDLAKHGTTAVGGIASAAPRCAGVAAARSGKQTGIRPDAQDGARNSCFGGPELATWTRNTRNGSIGQPFVVVEDAAAGERDHALGSRLSRSSLRRNGAALPWAFQSGRQMTWLTPRASAQLAAIFSTPGPPPCSRTMSPYRQYRWWPPARRHRWPARRRCRWCRQADPGTARAHRARAGSRSRTGRCPRRPCATSWSAACPRCRRPADRDTADGQRRGGERGAGPPRYALRPICQARCVASKTVNSTG